MTARQLRRLKLPPADSFVEDVMAMSEAEIDAELRADGLDPAEVIRDMNEAFERAFAKAKEAPT